VVQPPVWLFRAARAVFHWMQRSAHSATHQGAQPVATPGADQVRAREALLAYFTALHTGDYATAVRHYGGAYDVLRDWNPIVPRDAYAILFEHGCVENGLRCLAVREIRRETILSPTTVQFDVTFTAEDGSMFVRGPCCGANETETPSQSVFPFTVQQVNGVFLVQELPVYVP
jgi:hypothetical protein